MAVYFWQNKVLTEGGKVAMHADCCCAYDCGYDCVQTPPKLSAVVSGLTNCNQCVVHHTDGSKSFKWLTPPDGTYVLDQCGSGVQGNACRWIKSAVITDAVRYYYEASDCTGAYTDEDATVWIYAEYTGGDTWIMEGYGEFVSDYGDNIFLNLGEELTGKGCEPDGDNVPNDLDSGNCGTSWGVNQQCGGPNNAGVQIFYGGSITLTAIFE